MRLSCVQMTGKSGHWICTTYFSRRSKWPTQCTLYFAVSCLLTLWLYQKLHSETDTASEKVKTWGKWHFLQSNNALVLCLPCNWLDKTKVVFCFKKVSNCIQRGDKHHRVLGCFQKNKNHVDVGTWEELMILENGDLRNAHLCHSCPSIPFKRKTHESQKSSIHARHTSQMPNKQTLGVLGLNSIEVL